MKPPAQAGQVPTLPVENVPGAHAVQTVVDEEKVPEPHGEHPVLPVPELIEPAAQLVQI
jgi:hypothetical protein